MPKLEKSPQGLWEPYYTSATLSWLLKLTLGREGQPEQRFERAVCSPHSTGPQLCHLPELSPRASEWEKYFTIQHHKTLLNIELPQRCLVFASTGAESKCAGTVTGSRKCEVRNDVGYLIEYKKCCLLEAIESLPG